MCKGMLAVLLGLAVTMTAAAKDVKVLIITGDEVGAHRWKETAPMLKEILTKAGCQVDLTQTPGKDLTPENLAKYDVFLLNYKDTPQGAKNNPDSVWSEANKKAFLDAVKGGKGLVCWHFSSAAFTGNSPWEKEFEKAIGGGWRKQGYHGAMHEFTVKPCQDHPITHGLKEFKHGRDELYQNSLMVPGNEVIMTAYSDKAKDPKNTGKDEAMVWVNQYGKGRVVNDVMGHDVEAMKGKGFQTVLARCVEWAGTGTVTSPVPSDLKAK